MGNTKTFSLIDQFQSIFFGSNSSDKSISEEDRRLQLAFENLNSHKSLFGDKDFEMIKAKMKSGKSVAIVEEGTILKVTFYEVTGGIIEFMYFHDLEHYNDFFTELEELK